MDEAAVLGLRNEVTGLIVSIVSVSFGMISAYIVGLWLFLRRVPLLLRAIAFSMLSCGLAFMGGMLVGTDRAWAKVEIKSSEIPNFGGWRPDFLMGLSLYEIGALLGFISFTTIYVALAYMTFFYKWPEARNLE